MAGGAVHRSALFRNSRKFGGRVYGSKTSIHDYRDTSTSFSTHHEIFVVAKVRTRDCMSFAP